jgi:hypothetical protein
VIRCGMCRHCIADDVLRGSVRLFTGLVSALGRAAFEKIARGGQTRVGPLHALAPTFCDAFGSCRVLLESPLAQLSLTSV